VFLFDNPDIANVTFTLSGVSPAYIDLDLFVLQRDQCLRS